MPCVIQETREAGDFICEGPSPRRPESSAVFAAPPREKSFARVLEEFFRLALAIVATFVLLLSANYCANYAQEFFESMAKRGIVALSQGLGHLATNDYPVTDNYRDTLKLRQLRII